MGTELGEVVKEHGKKNPPQPERVVMVRVDGVEITVQDYANFLQRNPNYIQESMSENGKANVIRAMIANQILREEMFRQGLLSKARKTTVEDLKQAYEKLSEKHFPLPPEPSEESAYQYYLNHQKDYGIPEMVRISQIQFRYPENATPEQKTAAYRRAEGALRRLDAGEPFAKVAGELTENPRAKVTQGDLGFLPRERDPWLLDALKDRKVGEYTRILESPVGYEILLLTDVRPALVSPYPNVRDKVIQRMRAEAQAKQRDAYVRDLARRVKIEVVQEELKPLFPKGIYP